VVPAATPVANPVVEIVAVAVEEEFHVTVAETSAVEPSLKVAVAVNCCVLPTFSFAGVAGVTAIEVNVFPELGPLQPLRRTTVSRTTTAPAKRRGRDFISPPGTLQPNFGGGTPTGGRRGWILAALCGLE